MSPLEGTRAARFALVTAAHRFLCEAIPLRHPRSREALQDFTEAAADSRLRGPDLEAVLLRCLSVLNRHTGGRLPTLVERYFRRDHEGSDQVAKFRGSVEDVLNHRGVGNAAVQETIATIEHRYADSTLTATSVARCVGLRPSGLSAMFKAQTGTTVGQYVRAVRLDHAASLLANTTKSIKEIWASVGYNHASNFVHDFKWTFGVTPHEYRMRAIEPGADRDSRTVPPAPPPRTHESFDAGRGTILIVDDDEGTRDTIGWYLQRVEGYKAVAAQTGEQALRTLATVTPQAVLLDYHLPDMDGLEWLQVFRCDHGDARTPVILFTADWEVEAFDGEIRALGRTLLSKLCDLEEVGRRIALCVDSAKHHTD